MAFHSLPMMRMMLVLLLIMITVPYAASEDTMPFRKIPLIRASGGCGTCPSITPSCCVDVDGDPVCYNPSISKCNA
ncbi:hypothetical protein O6H91_17G058000 [Diphasiastrum complanatum]|uniref:Uncharacterized protein n=2 Tax=Diphasiastrum complanatum TaxID=34168 RepID=A0ACC2B766_DIPCM|nr:hypothetical protein O6H91_17G058000 [Diphasiastrum complanatum]KAJ7525595.1 hypothetical protein O6H91_17G058000 [Diphasiastrum complanatum]